MANPVTETVAEKKRKKKGTDKPSKPRKKAIEWGENPSWIRKALQYLINNVEFRLRLFSDSTVDAKAEDRKKSQGKEGKINMFGTLAEHIFLGDDDPVAPEWKEEYSKDPHRFATSLQQQFAKLKKTYSKHVRRLKDTGGGLLPKDQAENVIEQIREEFEFWDDLHDMWSELPNYNPIGVSNGSSGADHATNAALLFGKATPAMGSLGPSSCDGDRDGDERDDDAVGSGLDNVDQNWKSESSMPRSEPDGEDELDDDSDAVPNIVESLSAVDQKLKGKDVAAKSNGDKSGKKDKHGKRSHTIDEKPHGKKRPRDTSTLDDLHLKELEDNAQRRESRAAIRLKEIELQQSRLDAKREKMRLEAQKIERDHQTATAQAQASQQTLALMNHLLRTYGAQQPGFGSGMGLGMDVGAGDAGASNSGASSSSSPFTDPDYSGFNFQ